MHWWIWAEIQRLIKHSRFWAVLIFIFGCLLDVGIRELVGQTVPCGVDCVLPCRFSLLLLEPGEIYFEDFAAIYILPDEGSQSGGDGWESKFENGLLRGRLKVGRQCWQQHVYSFYKNNSFIPFSNGLWLVQPQLFLFCLCTSLLCVWTVKFWGYKYMIAKTMRSLVMFDMTENVTGRLDCTQGQKMTEVRHVAFRLFLCL